jgi:CheY-like chemotaxis protein
MTGEALAAQVADSVGPENPSILPAHNPLQDACGGRTLKILVVDDEIAILECMARLLCSLGHNVHAFKSCSMGDALRIIETAAGAEFDVAIIDVIMPGLDGMQMIELIHRVSPSTGFISSDCGPCIEVSNELIKKGLLVLPLLRPFEPGGIERTLDDMISLRDPNPKVVQDQNEGEEIRLRSQVSGAVQKIVYKFNPEGLSFVGSPCNKYSAHCKTIAKYVWQHFPYSPEKKALTRLENVLSETFSCEGKSVPYTEIASAIFSLLPPPFRGTTIQVTTSIRPYPRRCWWCDREIPKKQPALMLYGRKNGAYRPKFCSRDCYQNWDSVHWQRVALSDLDLSEKELRREKRNLQRQTRFRRRQA